MKDVIRTGRCWKIGDDVSSDELISARHVFEYDPSVLRKHLLAEVRPELSAEAQSGDVLLAGRRFAHGSHHSHPFLAMNDMGLGLLTQPLKRAPFRLSVFVGVPLLEVSEEVVASIQDGDRLEVDYGAGIIRNLTRGDQFEVPPLPDFLLDIVQAGGGLQYLKQQAARSSPVT